MRKYSIAIILSGLFIFVNIFILYKNIMNSNNFKSLYGSYSKILRRDSLLTQHYLNSVYLYQYDLKSFDISSTVKQILENEFKINAPKLIYYYEQNSCSNCVTNDLILLKNIANKIGKEKILIIVGGYSIKEANSIKDAYKLESTVISIEYKHLGLPINALNSPIFFLLNKNLKVYNVFIENENLSDLTLRYLEKAITSL